VTSLTLVASDTPVLIAGAGPVGATLALDLARLDIRSVLVERSPRPSIHPKMDYLNGRSMELFRRLGLADTIRERGVGPEHSLDFLWTRGLDEDPVLVWHQPSVEQMRRRFAAVNDGTAPIEPYQRIPGSALEELLREQARENPLIEVLEGWTLTGVEWDPGGVRVTVANQEYGVRAMTARFLVGCDGARSTVRRLMDIPMQDVGESTTYCSIYFRSGDPVLRRHGRGFLTLAAMGVTLVSRDEDRLWTASTPVPPSDPLYRNPLDLVQERLGVTFHVDETISVKYWEGSLGVAANYRRGPVFLAGDAAHRFYPAGGHGVNTGIGDAVDLAWKLAGTVDGWAGPALLDSYELERRPVALFNRELCSDLVETTRRFGRLAAAGVSRAQLAGLLEQEVHHVDNLGVHFGQRYNASPVIWPEAGEPPPWRWQAITASTWPGGRAPSVRLRNGSQLFDLLGPGYTIVDQSGRGLGDEFALAADRRQVPLAHLVVDDDAVRACWERDLVLVRPDHCVAWRGDQPPAEVNEVIDRIAGHRGISRRLTEVPRVCARG